MACAHLPAELVHLAHNCATFALCQYHVIPLARRPRHQRRQAEESKQRVSGSKARAADEGDLWRCMPASSGCCTYLQTTAASVVKSSNRVERGSLYTLPLLNACVRQDENSRKREPQPAHAGGQPGRDRAGLMLGTSLRQRAAGDKRDRLRKRRFRRRL